MHRHEGNQQDWTNHYVCIGEYVVEFENIVEKIRFELSAILQIRGLKDWKLSEIVFGQKQFTADPLITCFESMIYELFSKKPKTKEFLESTTKFKNKFKKQVAVRNDLLHSFYLIGPEKVTISDDPNPPQDLTVIKTSPTKEGARKKEVVKSIEDVKKNTIILRQLQKDFMKLTGDIVIYAHQNNMLVGFKSNKGKN